MPQTTIRPTPEVWTRLKPFAREMRKAPTLAEKHLWQNMRKKQIGSSRFRRQHAIDRFIVDFYCAAAQLVIEVDGSIHDEPEQQEYDVLRQAALESLGLRVLRFRNEEVLENTTHVLEIIRTSLTL